MKLPADNEVSHVTIAKRGTAASPIVLALLLTSALLQSGCVADTALVGRESVPNGKIQISSATFGSFTLMPAACASGEHHLFLGADFLDGARGTALRLILEPTGEATLRVFDTAHPLKPGMVVSHTTCSKILISLERTGWRINDIYDLRVGLEVECRTAAGDSLQGMLTVAHCH